MNDPEGSPAWPFAPDFSGAFILPPSRPESSSAGEPRRFEREVQLTAKLTHPNTVAIYDFGRTPDGIFYYAMELLDGIDLEGLADEHGPQPPARVVHILAQVCASLAEAHAIGLVHRDVKPANVILCERGRVPDTAKVVDFGLVKDVGGLSVGEDVALSNVNSIIGTPLYLAPEAILTPDEVDGRADLYAVGAVAYFMLTGSQVFSGKSVMEVCSEHLRSPPVPPSVRRRSPRPLAGLRHPAVEHRGRATVVARAPPEVPPEHFATHGWIHERSGRGPRGAHLNRRRETWPDTLPGGAEGF